MGIVREHNGYSARVEGYIQVQDARFRLAKTSSTELVLDEDCELAPGTEVDLVIIVDDWEDSKRIAIPDGIVLGNRYVRYTRLAPF